MKRALMMVALLCPLISPADDMLAEEWAAGIGQLDQVRDGLVSYWAMRQTGTQVVDEVGSVPLNLGPLVTTATSNGIVGTGANIGALAGVSLGLYSSGVYTIVPPFSVSIWYAFGNDENFALVFGSYDGTRGLLLDQQTTIANGLRFRNLPLTNNIAIPLAVTTPSNYQHVVFSSDGLTVAFYINGVLATSVTTTIQSHTNYVYSGYRPDSTGGNDNFGKRDEWRIYNRALSASDAVQLHHMGEYLRGTK